MSTFFIRCPHLGIFNSSLVLIFVLVAAYKRYLLFLIFFSLEVNVWNEESPAVSALGSPKSSRQKQSSEKGVPPRVMDQEPKEVQTAYADVSALSTIESTASEPSSPSPHILSAVQNGKNKGYSIILIWIL